MIDGGERRGRKQKNVECECSGGSIRRSVPLDRVLDAVKRTWNPSYFFTGRLFLFFFLVRCGRIHCQTIGEDVGAEEEENRPERERKH